jgi:hypothetical protein
MGVLDARYFRYDIENGALHVGWYTEMPPLGNIVDRGRSGWHFGISPSMAGSIFLLVSTTTYTASTAFTYYSCKDCSGWWHDGDNDRCWLTTLWARMINDIPMVKASNKRSVMCCHQKSSSKYFDRRLFEWWGNRLESFKSVLSHELNT